MSGNPFLSGRVPRDLYERVEQHCQETETSKTELMIAALRQYLDCPAPAPTASDDTHLDRIESTLQDVLKRLDSLEQQRANKHYNGSDYKQLEVGLNNESCGQGKAAQNSGDKNKFPKYVKPARYFKSGTGISKKDFQKAKTEMQPSKTIPDNALIGTVEGEECHVWFLGKEGRSERWAAHPIEQT